MITKKTVTIATVAKVTWSVRRAQLVLTVDDKRLSSIMHEAWNNDNDDNNDNDNHDNDDHNDGNEDENHRCNG